jgi:hypothetical protein
VEIDVLLQVEPLGARVPIFAENGANVIGEAKRYSSAPKTEWVNEMRGFMDTKRTTFGILFLGCKSRTLASDIRTAIALHRAQGRNIVPFGTKQLEQVKSGVAFLRVLADQYTAAAFASSTLEI